MKMTMVTTFSGVGMQERGVKNTNLFDVEVLATCETDINAIISYAAIHNGLTMKIVDEYQYPSREKMAEDLIVKNIGYDFLKKKPYDWMKVANSKDSKKLLQRTWLSCELNKNVGDISKVDTFPKCGLFTFSFPCTDLSVAGKCAGMAEGETRSGLVWEVVRILKNMKSSVGLPNFLLMENVDALINQKNLSSYEKLNEEFDELGYQCIYSVLNGKFCGVPQNRKRVFAIYALKNINLDKYIFPLKFDLGIRLKDILLDEVDEKYYISGEGKNEKANALVEELMLAERNELNG